ncbi:MAG: penicillin-binding transpeptidase domain-containing protein [Pseudomonadota bacterium]|nr:penicillin-binding transpeptidase domain-containing protein [Pseudomonadota bacterium]
MKQIKKTFRQQHQSFILRIRVATGFLLLSGLVLILQATYLQIVDQDFLNDQAEARHLRIANLAAHRGIITDRNNEPLAVSTPVDSVWVNPNKLLKSPDDLSVLSELLQEDSIGLTEKITRNSEKEFLYLKRHMNPSDASKIKAQNISGVYLQREYRRYYPAAEVTGHLIGFANIDDVGQEALELAFDHRLAGKPGRKRVLKDMHGKIVEDIESIEASEPGQNISTSIDLRIQYLAYTELMKAVRLHGARSGSAVVLDVHTGEVLAMVNQPSYNPNNRLQRDPRRYRNRAITDIFEPGSSIKPLIIAAGLETSKFQPTSSIDTNPGYIQIGTKKISDTNNLGRIDLTTVLARSSNVGATMVAISIAPRNLWQILTNFGLGQTTAAGFPGESAGLLSDHENWRSIRQATLGYGYGLSVTPLQLAQAYAVFGADGLKYPVSLMRVSKPAIPHRVVSKSTSKTILNMLEHVVSVDGTGRNASVSGYRVAGKTGTTRKNSVGGYSEERYMAIFAGIGPVSNPQLSIVVVIDEPSSGKYYGGDVAAPVFSKIFAAAARILSIPPDNLDGMSKAPLRVAMQ